MEMDSPYVQMKKFEANSVKEALRAVRRELGPDAFIISTKEKKSDGEFGLFAKPIVEVTAALNDSPSASAPVQRQMDTQTLLRESHLPVLQEESKPAVPAAVKPAESPIPGIIEKELDYIKAFMKRMEGNISRHGKSYLATGIHDEFTELKYLLYEVMRTNLLKQEESQPDYFVRIYTKLKVSGIKEVFISNIMNTLRSSRNPFTEDDRIHEFNEIEDYFGNLAIRIMLKKIPISGGITLRDNGPNIVAFNGPSGSGKTTSLAKIAADFVIRKQKKVAIVSLDNYRIAASEQLKTFANILKVPLQVVAGESDYRMALHNFKDKDLILVDMPGQLMGQAPIVNFDLKEVEPKTETYLVLSAINSSSYLETCIKGFNKNSWDALLFTFIDEAPTLGSIYNATQTSGKPLAYFSFGQKVPEDIEVATKERIVEKIFQG